MNAPLFGANILLVGLVIRRYTGSLFVGLFGSFLTLTSLGMLIVHSMAWTEPLFLFFAVLGLVLLAAYLEDPTGSQTLYASVVATALAFLDRYMGAALVMAGVSTILFLGGGTGRGKVRDTLIFGVLSGLPTGLWIAYSRRVSGGAAGRHIVYHPISLDKFHQPLHTLLTWLAPEEVSYRIEHHLLAFVILGILLAGVAVMSSVLRRHGSGWVRTSDKKRAFPSILLPLLGFFVAIYSGLLILAISFTDVDADLGQRTLAPMYVSGLILTMCLVNRRVHSASGRRVPTGATVILCAALASSYSFQARVWVSNAHHQGLGYASEKWRQSPIIQRVRVLPPGIGVYTNGPDAVYILTDKRAATIPAKFDYMTGLKNRDYASQISIMRRELEANGAVVVYIDARMWPGPRSYLPTEVELREAVPLRLIERVSDGSIYRTEP